MDVKQLTAPCGLPCFACAVYKENITEEMTQFVAKAHGITPEEVPCSGCRSAQGCPFEKLLTDTGCPTKKCVEAKRLHNCSECSEFPCENLMPTADLAKELPHNTKMYNLARIKLIGLEAWAKEAPLIQKKYFMGKFVYGAGAELDGDK